MSDDRHNRPPRPPQPQGGHGRRPDRPPGKAPQRPQPPPQQQQGARPQNARPGDAPRNAPPGRAPQPPGAPQKPRHSQRPQGQGQPRQGPAQPAIPKAPKVPSVSADAQRPSRRPPPPASPEARDARPPPPDGARGERPRQRRSLPPEAPAEVREAPATPAAKEPEPERTELPYGRRVYLPLTSETPPEDDLGEPDFPEYNGPEHAWLASVALVRVGDAPRPLACDAGNLTLRKGDAVVVEGERGVDLAVVSSPPRRQMVEGRLAHRVSRKANESDLRAESRTRLKEAEAVRVANDIVRALKLPTKVVRAEVSLSGGRTVVYLASEERLEMRDLGRRLTDAFRGRVEIRHIGVRDAAKNIGGVGPCGLQLCCNTFLSDFAPVSIRQAKDQGLALNPQRVSGVCGRLMCCLVYEDAFYRQQRALFPKQGKRVQTPKGEGRVRDLDVLARTVRVLFPDGAIETFKVEEVRPFAPPGGPPQGRPDANDDADDGSPDESPVADS